MVTTLSDADSAPLAPADTNKDLTGMTLIALENTPSTHHLVVCTLCSCYPLAILGLSPSWYKSRSYRARAVREPRAVLREFGTELPADVRIRVVDSNADTRCVGGTITIRPVMPVLTAGRWPAVMRVHVRV